MWPVGTLEKMPVFLEEDRVSGPGVFDMKGGLTQMVFALKILDDLGMEPEVSPVVFVKKQSEPSFPNLAWGWRGG